MFLNRVLLTLLALLIGWPWMTLAVLMVFRISMRQARVTTVHVVRCVVYSCDVAAWYFVVMTGVLLTFAYRQAFGMRFPDGPVVYAAIWTPGAIALLTVLYRLVVSYGTYLRFHRPFLTALASQAMVTLFAFTCLLLIALS